MKVLYVLGRGRSGSTIFGNVLGELDGFFCGGEIRFLWDPVVVRRSVCGCGSVVFECPVWSQVLERLSDVDVAQVARWQHAIVKEHNTFRLLRHRNGKRWDALESYALVMRRLYDALAAVTGANVIVDTSKRPSYAAFLETLDDVDPYYVHLVREPHASAHSWRSRKYESARGGREVKRRSAFDATLRWDLLNLGSEAVLRRAGAKRALRIRYEDFVAAPREKVDETRALLGEAGWRSPFVDDRTVTLRVNHAIAGNPSRFSTGTLVLQDTSEWREAQSRLDRWVTTVVALPFLHRYGYGSKRPAA
ncbi:MAG TPA: sulfotransferase [Actinomycetota bacterium]|nr:sulfotransferase [Actinomycetota bacterium]